MAAPNSSAGWLERLFKLSDNKTTFRTEVLAGVTTFLTMCYIIIVNPLILSETGMDHGAVFVATCLAAAIGCLVMGIIANYPIALAWYGFKRLLYLLGLYGNGRAMANSFSRCFCFRPCLSCN